jgi:DNA-binding MarR family transcriptional regulator
MRRRVPDNADTRLFLSKVLRAVDRGDLPVHAMTLLLYISAQADARAGYSDTARECDLNDGQMERAVKALLDNGLIARIDALEDRRRKQLQTTRTGESVVGHLIAHPYHDN